MTGIKKFSYFFLLVIGIMMCIQCKTRIIQNHTSYNIIKIFNVNPYDNIEDNLLIQYALDRSQNKTLFFPKGIYLINPNIPLIVPSNCHIVLEKGAIIKALPVENGSYSIFHLKNSINVIIEGDGEIIGERFSHKGTTGEWGMGIKIEGACNFTIKGITISECWGDGIYIMGNKENGESINGKILDVKSYRNRRQGLSIVAGKDISIIGGSYSFTNGTSPQAGIDLEPNLVDPYVVENITIRNVKFQDNLGSGLMVSGESNRLVKIDSIVSFNNERGVSLISVGDSISVYNSSIFKNKLEGIKVASKKNHFVNFLTIKSNRCYLNGFEGITLWNNITFGEISNNEVYENGYQGIHLRPSRGYEISNLKIYNNNVHSNSQVKNETFANIEISGNSNNNIIQNNKVYKGVLQNKPIWGIFISKSALYNSINENITEDGGIRSGLKIENN